MTTPSIENAIFDYASNILPPRKISTLVIGTTETPCHDLVTQALGTERVGAFRQIISLEGYAHANTRRPENGTVDFLFVDARTQNLDDLEDLFNLAQDCLAPRARSAWLLDPEFMDSPLSAPVRHSLSAQYTITHLHHADDSPTPHVVVWSGNAAPTLKQTVILSRGGQTDNPTTLADLKIAALRDPKPWSLILPPDEQPTDYSSDTLGAHFNVERGIATGNDDFFIMSHNEIIRRELEADLFRAVIPAPHLLENEIIEARPGGFPDVDQRLVMLHTSLSPAIIAEQYPKVAHYIKEAESQGIATKAEFASREHWYALPDRPSPPILCAANPDQPCCFILNMSRALATDQYLAFYPKPHLATAISRNALLLGQIWSLLNEAIEIIDEDIMLETAASLEIAGLSELLGQ